MRKSEMTQLLEELAFIKENRTMLREAVEIADKMIAFRDWMEPEII